VRFEAGWEEGKLAVLEILVLSNLRTTSRFSRRRSE
jgi:hypothetical protein